jgi:hypothetical protein
MENNKDFVTVGNGTDPVSMDRKGKLAKASPKFKEISPKTKGSDEDRDVEEFATEVD